MKTSGNRTPARILLGSLIYSALIAAAASLSTYESSAVPFDTEVEATITDFKRSGDGQSAAATYRFTHQGHDYVGKGRIPADVGPHFRVRFLSADPKVNTPARVYEYRERDSGLFQVGDWAFRKIRTSFGLGVFGGAMAVWAVLFSAFFSLEWLFMCIAARRKAASAAQE
jgi:hypothetical protein